MIIYISAFLTSFLLTYVVKFIAHKKSLIDIPNERSSHNFPTARGGGLAIAATWFIAISYLYYVGSITPNLYYALITGSIISVISFVDDIYNLKSSPRLVVQCIAAVIALYFIGGLHKVDLGFFVIENVLLLNSIAFVGIVWFVNLFNFTDGIDGYAASETIFVSLSLFFFLEDSLLLLFATTVFGFLLWNWDKAKIFMGDVGSTLLGFTICILAIHYHNTSQFSIINSLILTSLFWFDATITLLKRFINKENIGTAHKKHAYQRIVQYGFSHQKTVICAMIINLLLFAIVIGAQATKEFITLYLLLTCTLMYVVYKYIDTKTPFE
jgi:Fuc2NAc and GlcNAc transferase